MHQIWTPDRRIEPISRYGTLYPNTLPPVTDGLTFFAPLTRDYGTVPIYSAAGTTGLATETVDADWTFKQAYSNYITQATANNARIEQYGVRVDPTRTNLCSQSAAINVDGAGNPWTHSGTTTSQANDTSVTDPMGGNTADRMRDTTDNSTHLISQNVTVGAAAAHCWSMFVRYVDHRWIAIRGDGNAAKWASFDLLNGVVGAKTAGVTSGIEAWPNSWYRIWQSHTTHATPSAAGCIIAFNNADTAGSATYVGTGTKVHMFGMQVEAGSAPSSYIPTGAASVQGTGDVLKYALASILSASAGTLHLLFTPQAATQTAYVLDWSADADNEFHLDLNAGVPRFTIERATAQQAQLSSTSAIAINTPTVISLCWGANDVRLYVNGADEKSDTSATMPASINASLFLGTDISSANAMLGNIGFLVGYSTTQTAAEVLDVSNWIRVQLGLL